MSRDDKDPLTWGDLRDGTTQNSIDRQVKKTLRTCIVYLSPFIFVILGGVAWYADKMVDGIESNGKVSVQVLSRIAGMKENISANKDGIIWLRNKFDR